MQNTALNIVKTGIATCLGFISWFLGGFDGMVLTLIIFMVVDYITGVMLAIQNKRVDSKVGFKGISRKVLELLFIGMASVLDTYLIGGNSPMREVIISFYIANEGISVIENSAKLGLPVPKKLVEILTQLKGEEDKAIEEYTE